MKNINNECPCDYENTDYCTFCRDRNTTVNMYNIDDKNQALTKAGIQNVQRNRIFTTLLDMSKNEE